MKGDVCMYPYHLEARRLPVYLTGLGGTAWQMPIRRPEGYFWHQVLLCTEGSGTLETGGRQQPIRAGDAFLLPAEQPHAYWPETERWDVRWITFGASIPLPEHCRATTSRHSRRWSSAWLIPNVMRV